MTHYLKLGSKKIEIQQYPGKQKNLPCLIFLHEGLGCTQLWKDFPLKLSQHTGCPALVFSRFGYGRSDPCPLPWKINFMHKEALKILPAILSAAKIKTYILIGHSDGGSIGIISAGTPHLSTGLKGLITEAAHVFCEPITLDCIHQAKINYQHHGLKPGLKKYHGKNTDNAFWGWNNVWLHPKFIHWNIEKYLNRIKVPLMAIQGKNDPYGTLKQLESIKKQVSEAKIILVDNCGHSPHNDQSEKVLQVMTNFICRICT